MQQTHLNRAVARATGESVATIKRLGFLLEDIPAGFDPEDAALGPNVIDWDELESRRYTKLARRLPGEIC